MKKNKCGSLVLSSLVVTGTVLFSSIGSVASAASMGFSLGGADNFGSEPVKADFMLTEVNGGVRFDVTVDTSVNMADLRGVFFNIKDESLLSGLTYTSGTYETKKGKNIVENDYITDVKIGPANQVSDLGNGVNLNGNGAVGGFDGGFEVGTSGIGKDDLQFASFTLSHSTKSLGLSDFEGQGFGVRMTSVGANREGSSKVDGYIPPFNPDPGSNDKSDSVDIPEPSALAALGLVMLGATKIKRKLAA